MIPEGNSDPLQGMKGWQTWRPKERWRIYTHMRQKRM